MLVGELPKPAGLLDTLSRSSAGLGSSPTSIFTGLWPVKISECGHTRIACHYALPLNGIISPTLDKNIPPYENRFILFVRVYRYTDIGKVVSQ